MRSGGQYLAESKFAEAAIQFHNAVDLDPKDGQARLRLATAYTNLGDRRNALEQYVRAADLLPDNAEVQLTAGTHLLAARRANDALGRADAVLARNPKNAAAHLLRGSALAGLNALEEAVGEIEQAVELDAGQSHAYASLGALQFVRGRNREAEDALEKAVSLSPRWVGGHLTLANYYWNVGRVEDAERSLRAALSLEPDNVLANRTMAALLVSTGRAADAEAFLKRIAVRTNPFAILVLADFYVAMNRPADAIAQLDPLKSNPRVAAAAEERLVKAKWAAGDRSGAYRVSDELLKRNDRDSGARLAKGLLLLEDGKFEAALEYIQGAADADPASTSAQFALGKLQAVRGDLTAAENAFVQVLRTNPRVGAAQVALAHLYLASNRSAAAVTAARSALSSDPANVRARLVLVRGLIANNDLAGAQREIEALARDYPRLAQVEVEIGVIATLRGETRNARSAFERAAALDPASHEALAGLVVLDLAAQQYESAKARIRERLASSPRSGPLLLLAARTHAAAKDLPGAEQFLNQAVDVDPSLLAAYAMLGELYIAQHRLDDAQRQLETLAARQSRPVAALTMIGMILQAKGENEAAIRQFEKVVALDPMAAVASNNLAWLYAESGERLDIALQLARTAAAALPDAADVIDTLGWVYYKKRVPESAIDAFTRCVHTDPRNPTYQAHLGLAYAQAGDAPRAKTALETAFRIRSDFEGAAEGRRVLSALSAAGR